MGTLPLQRTVAGRARDRLAENKIDGDQEHAREHQRLDHRLLVVRPPDQEALRLHQVCLTSAVMAASEARASEPRRDDNDAQQPQQTRADHRQARRRRGSLGIPAIARRMDTNCEWG